MTAISIGRNWVRGTTTGRSRPRPNVLAVVLGITVATAVAAPLLPLADPASQDLAGSLAGVSGEHWLGTDELGRDLLARLIFGARTTFLAAFTALGVTAAIGLPLGLLAGYWRGPVDAVVSRIADAVMAVPPLILLLAAIAALGPGITKSMIVLGVILSPRLFRVVRASTIGLANAGFLEVGRMSGCPTGRMLLRYALPNIRAQVVVQLSLLLGYAVLTEAGISFLGLGVQPPSPSLGVLLKSGVEYMNDAALLTLAPGFVLTAFILACNVLGDSYTASKEQM